MKRFLLLATVIFSAPVWAADDDAYTIKIIHEDGSKDVIDLRRSAQEPVEAAPEVVPAPELAPAVDPAPKSPVAKAEPVIDPGPEPALEATPARKPKVKKAAEKPPPPPPAPAIIRPPPMPVQRKALESGSPGITRAQAISIAMDYAPPARDVEVYRSQFEGADVLAVVFKTEDGFHEVLLEPKAGRVLGSRESKAFKNSSQPGHLAPSLR